MNRILYPVLIDHEAPAIAKLSGDANVIEDGNNFVVTSLTSRSLYVYFVGTFRNILRRKVLFSYGPLPTPPPPPTPNNATSCNHLLVSGAGEPTANGMYTKQSNHTSDGCAFFSNARSTHQIYRVNQSGGHEWHLGHFSFSGTVLYVSSVASSDVAITVPSINKWNLGSNATVLPAPATVTCLA